MTHEFETDSSNLLAKEHSSKGFFPIRVALNTVPAINYGRYSVKGKANHSFKVFAKAC